MVAEKTAKNFRDPAVLPHRLYIYYVSMLFQ